MPGTVDNPMMKLQANRLRAFVGRLETYSALKLNIRYMSFINGQKPGKEASVSEKMDFNDLGLLQGLRNDKLKEMFSSADETKVLGRKRELLEAKLFVVRLNKINDDEERDKFLQNKPPLALAYLCVLDGKKLAAILKNIGDQASIALQTELGRNIIEADAAIQMKSSFVAGKILENELNLTSAVSEAKSAPSTPRAIEEAKDINSVEENSRTSTPSPKQALLPKTVSKPGSQNEISRPAPKSRWKAYLGTGLLSGSGAITLTVLILVNSWNPIGWAGVAFLGLIAIGGLIKAWHDYPRSPNTARAPRAKALTFSTGHMGESELGKDGLVLSKTKQVKVNTAPAPVPLNKLRVAPSVIPAKAGISRVKGP